MVNSSLETSAAAELWNVTGGKASTCLPLPPLRSAAATCGRNSKGVSLFPTTAGRADEEQSSGDLPRSSPRSWRRRRDHDTPPERLLSSKEAAAVDLDMGCGAKKSLADPPKQFFSLKSCDISSTRPHLLLVRGRRKLPPLSSSQKKFPPPSCVNYRWKNDAHMAIRDCHRARKINPTSFRALLFIAEALSQIGKYEKALEFAICAQSLAPY
nr:WD and tetratricopeptide repeats protein 1-like isoform X2 [Ipomoea batatas]